MLNVGNHFGFVIYLMVGPGLECLQVKGDSSIVFSWFWLRGMLLERQQHWPLDRLCFGCQGG